MIKVLTSYLQDRNQCTSLECECSQRMDVTYGVPRGSVLGPKLFLLYINDLTQVIRNCRFYLYADDIVLHRTIRPQHSENDFQLFIYDINAVTNWCAVNELTINIKKTKVQYFPRNRNIDCLLFETNNIVKIKNSVIAYVTSFKYLEGNPRTMYERFRNSHNYVILSAKSSLILGENKAGFPRESHIYEKGVY